MAPQSPLTDHKLTAQPHRLSEQRGGSSSTKAARAALAKHTINTVIPHILKHNTRARLGNASTEPIAYSPYIMSIKAGVRSRPASEDEEVTYGKTDPVAGKEKQSEKRERASSKSSPSKKGKITGFFKVLPKVTKISDADSGLVPSTKNSEPISRQESGKSMEPKTEKRDMASPPPKVKPFPIPAPYISPYFSAPPKPYFTVPAQVPLPRSPPPKPYFAVPTQSPLPPSSTSSSPSSTPYISSDHFPKITVIQSDTLEAAQAFVDPTIKDRRIAVLNMASFLRPGGGVIQGAIAQEESLCLRSTLYTSLDEKFYRLPRFGGLFTEDILVFRDINNNDLPTASRYYIDVLSIAALKNPDLVPNPQTSKMVYEHSKDYEEMMCKIKLIFLTAKQKKTTHLILGALGCGAYYNPPEEVANMFKRCIYGDRRGRGKVELGDVLEEVVFAIFDDGVNLRVFGEVLGRRGRVHVEDEDGDDGVGMVEMREGWTGEGERKGEGG